MRYIIAALAAIILTACGGGSPTEAPAMPQSAATYTLQCNGTPKTAIVYLHSWAATHDEVKQYSAIVNAPDACVIAPSFGDMMPNSIYGTQAAIDQIDAAVNVVMQQANVSTVKIIAVSGGTAPATTYISQHGDKVSAASMWFAIFDLQTLYEGTSMQRLRDDMVTVIGHVPMTTRDPDYLVRSPSKGPLGMLPQRMELNVGDSDTVVPGTQTGMLFIHCANFAIHTWPIGHVFGDEQAAEAMRQLGL